jgi:diadenosine tetraphosphatase ApaH/serine/threonine PP2A family protein phosphatase
MIRQILENFAKCKPARAPARIPEGMRIYAIGDIHGRLDLLEQCQAKIVADVRNTGHLKIVQIFLGDYIDRGSNSKGVVDFLLQPAPAAWDRICLKGNHEAMVPKFLADPQVLDLWSRNGGLETLHSYGAGIVKQPGEGSHHRIREKFAQNLPDTHQHFFSTLQLSAEFGDYFFVHAGVRPDVALEDQEEEDLLWIRKEFVTSKVDFGKVIVHGHTPSKQPEVRFNRINIDTAAWMSGQLTCLVLEGAQQRFL